MHILLSVSPIGSSPLQPSWICQRGRLRLSLSVSPIGSSPLQPTFPPALVEPCITFSIPNRIEPSAT